MIVYNIVASVTAPNVPHDIATKREEEERLLGTTFCLELWSCQERAFSFSVYSLIITFELISC